MMKILQEKTELVFFAALTIISLIALASVYLFHFNGPPIRSDGMGYYAYLPSTFIYGDLSMKSLVEERNMHYNGELTPDQYGINIYPETGKYLDKYTMGEALMLLPFFIVANFLTLIASNFTTIEVNGFSAIYQVFIALAGLTYMILGLFIMKRLLEKYLSKIAVYTSLIVITFGTNLFHYGTYDDVFSHAFSFFLVSCLLYYVQKWRKKINFKHTIMIGIIGGLIVLTRPTNIIFLLIIPFYGFDFNKLKQNLQLYWAKKKYILLLFTTIFLIVLPQLLYWKYITGHWIVFSYSGEYFDFIHPQILNVLFSIKKGLFFWSPILLLTFAGIVISLRFFDYKTKNYIWAPILILIINTYVISSWWAWEYGGSFGHRAFIESYPLILGFLAIFYERIRIKKNKVLKIATIVVTCFCIFLSMYTMLLYWTGKIPFNGTTWETYMNALLSPIHLTP